MELLFQLQGLVAGVRGSGLFPSAGVSGQTERERATCYSRIKEGTGWEGSGQGPRRPGTQLTAARSSHSDARI